MSQLPGYINDGNEYEIPKAPEPTSLLTELAGFGGAMRAAVELGAAPLADKFALGGQDNPELPRLSPEEIADRQKAEGVTFAINPIGMTEFEVNYRIEKARAVQEAEAKAAKASGATQFVGGVIGSMIDPTIFMPVPGLNNAANRLILKTGAIASRTGRIAARTAVRLGEGAIEGAAGAAVMAPVVAEGYAGLGREYGLEEFASDIGNAAAGGAVLRGLLVNPIQEALWRRQGASVYTEVARKLGIRDQAAPAQPEAPRTGEQAVQDARAADVPTVERGDIRERVVEAPDEVRKAWADGLTPEDRARFLDADGRLTETGVVALRDASALQVLGEQNLSRLVNLGDDASDALIEGVAMSVSRIDAAPVARQTVEAIADVLARSREEGIPVSRLPDVDERLRTMATEVQRLGDAPQSIAAVLGRFGDLSRGMETADDAGEAFLDAIATAWNDASAGARLERIGENGTDAVVQATMDGMVSDRAVSMDAQVSAAAGVGDAAAANAEAMRNMDVQNKPFRASEERIEALADEHKEKALKEPETPDEARKQADDEVKRAEEDLDALEREIERLRQVQNRASRGPNVLPDDKVPTVANVTAAVRASLGDAGARWIEDGRAKVMTLEQLRGLVPNIEADAVGVEMRMVDGSRQIVLVADQLRGRDPGRTLLHEIFHFQREAILGDVGWAELRSQVARNMRSVLDAEARGDVLEGDLKAWRNARDMVPSNTGQDLPALQRADLIDEETIAYLIESAPESGFVRGIIAKVRAWLFQQGFKLDLTEADLRALAVSMMRRPVQGRSRMGARYSAAGGEAVSLPERIDIDGVQRPTRNSAGQPLARTEEGVRNFWKWFGDSKVVDEAGNPLVVYHGTKGDVSTFDIKKAGASDPGLVGRAFYFTPSGEQASSFAESGMYGRGDAPNVMPVYLSLKNPAIIRDGVLPDGRSLRDVHPQGITKSSAAAIRKDLARRSYDGAIFYLGDEATQFVAFNPNQIKSATGNRGTFDPSNPDIRYSRKTTPRTLRESLRAAVDRMERAEVVWPAALERLQEFDARAFEADNESVAALERAAVDRLMQADQSITAEDATALLSAWLSTGGDTKKTAENLLMAQAAIVRRQAINARRTADNFKRIITSWSRDEIGEGLISLDDASMFLRSRSRQGTVQVQKGMEASYKGFLHRKLGDLVEYASGHKMSDAERAARDLEIFTALRDQITPDGPNPGNLSEMALRAADAIRQTFAFVRRRGHELGEVQGELEDWGLTQAHDKIKLQNAAATISGDKRAGTVVRSALARKRGKFARLGSRENFEAWAAFTVPHMDLERMGIRADPTLPISQWTKKARRSLESIYEGAAGLKRRADEFGVTERQEVPGEVDDPRGVLQAFEEMQARRVIHFKDAKSAFAYNQMFGSRDLFGGVNAILEKAAMSHGQRYIYGASPEAARGRLIQMLQDHVGMEGRANVFSTITAWKMKVIHDEVTGRLNDPVNAVASRTMSNLRAYSGASKLASTAITQLMDAIPASISHSFRFGGNALGGSLKMLGRLVMRFDGAERNAALDNLLAGHESQVGEILRDQRGDIGGATAWLYDMTMKLGLVNYLDNTNIRTVAGRIAHGFGEAASKPGSMPQTERLLAAYGFEGPEDLRVLREASATVGGRPFLSPEHVTNVSREALDAYAAKRGLTPDQAADDLELMLQTLISSEISMARMAPTARTRGLMKLGTRSGSFAGEVVRAAGQFKSYPFEYARRVWVEWPDALGGRNLLDMPFAGKVRVAGWMATMIAGGLLVQQLKALRDGKMPLPVTEDGSDEDQAFKLGNVPLVNDQTLIRSIMQAGVIPIYMDQILGPDAVEPSKAVAEAVMGPTVGGLFTTSMSLLNTVKSFDPEAEDYNKAVSTVNADLIRAAKGWTPFVGHWATKAAMDRLVWWQLQEMASPGWADKFEERSNMKGGTPYMGMRPTIDVMGQQVSPQLPEWMGRTFTATPTEAVQ